MLRRTLIRGNVASGIGVMGSQPIRNLLGKLLGKLLGTVLGKLVGKLLGALLGKLLGNDGGDKTISEGQLIRGNVASGNEVLGSQLQSGNLLGKLLRKLLGKLLGNGGGDKTI